MKKLIAVLLLGLAGAQVAVANENNTLSDPYWAPRTFMVAETTQYSAARAEADVRNYDLVDRYNP